MCIFYLTVDLPLRELHLFYNINYPLGYLTLPIRTICRLDVWTPNEQSGGNFELALPRRPHGAAGIVASGIGGLLRRSSSKVFPPRLFDYPN